MQEIGVHLSLTVKIKSLNSDDMGLKCYLKYIFYGVPRSQ